MNTALLLIDIQNDYFRGGASELWNPESALLKAKEILGFFRKQNLPLFHIQHIALRPGSTFFIPGTNGALIHPEVNPLEGEVVITKHFPNSFVGTNLLESLKAASVKKLVICGMMTHMCVDATVRAAKDLGFEIIVPGDACATKNLTIFDQLVSASDVHNSFLAALNYYYARVMKTEELLQTSFR